MPLPANAKAALTALVSAVTGSGAVWAGTPAPWAIAAAAGSAGLAAWLLRQQDDTGPTQPIAEPGPDEEKGTPDDLLAPAVLAMPFGVLIVGADRMVRFSNPALRDMFGIDTLDGAAVATLRAWRLLDRIETAFQHRTASVLEFTLSRRTESTLEAHINPLPSGDVLVTIEDQTQARRAGETHRDFVANASHELKTPLAAVSGIIETLQGHARHDPKASDRFFGMLQSQTLRMTRLVEDLLSLNRIELNERVVPNERHDLRNVLSEAVDALRPIADANDVTLVWKTPTDQEIWVMADRDELAQVFGNLIDNAIKYGGGGSSVGIDLFDIADSDDQVAVEIRDEGPGIAREHIPRLTERFYRVDVSHSRATGGTGLGLAIVKHVLTRHRGRLEIESTQGEGSCFRTILPRAAADQKMPSADEAASGLQV